MKTAGRGGDHGGIVATPPAAQLLQQVGSSRAGFALAHPNQLALFSASAGHMSSACNSFSGRQLGSIWFSRNWLCFARLAPVCSDAVRRFFVGRASPHDFSRRAKTSALCGEPGSPAGQIGFVFPQGTILAFLRNSSPDRQVALVRLVSNWLCFARQGGQCPWGSPRCAGGRR